MIPDDAPPEVVIYHFMWAPHLFAEAMLIGCALGIVVAFAVYTWGQHKRWWQ